MPLRQGQSNNMIISLLMLVSLILHLNILCTSCSAFLWLMPQITLTNALVNCQAPKHTLTAKPRCSITNYKLQAMVRGIRHNQSMMTFLKRLDVLLAT